MLASNGSSKRERAERAMADWLSRRWELLSGAEQVLAIETAYEFGETFGEDCEGEPDLAAYVDVCVEWARELDVIGDVELAAWRFRAEGDPRTLVFALGCASWRREHG